MDEDIDQIIDFLNEKKEDELLDSTTSAAANPQPPREDRNHKAFDMNAITKGSQELLV